MGFGPSAVCDISLNTKLNLEQRQRFQNSKTIRDLLGSAKVIAVVGASTETTKASSMVTSYLMDEGYRVYPINPRAKEILGVPCYPDLQSVPEPIDVVDVFRPSNEVPAIVDEAVRLGVKAVWLQLRIIHVEAADRALTAGVQVVMDKCIKMEHGRFGGNLHLAGMNTEIVTAQRARR